MIYSKKGLTTQSILAAAERLRSIDSTDHPLMQLYKRLYDGGIITFDLCDGKPCFKMGKDFTITTLTEFKRNIRTKYAIGS